MAADWPGFLGHPVDSRSIGILGNVPYKQALLPSPCPIYADLDYTYLGTDYVYDCNEKNIFFLQRENNFKKPL